MTKAEKIYEALMERVLAGEIRESDVLTEAGLVETYQVSKSPVREALVRLCNENVLRPVPRLGYMLVPLTRERIEEVLEMREAIELTLFDRVTAEGKLDEKAVAELRRLYEAHRKDEVTRNKVTDHWARNQEFHLYLARLSGNDYMQEELEHVFRILLRATTHYFLDPQTNQKASHGEFVEALEADEVARARALLQADIMNILG